MAKKSANSMTVSKATVSKRVKALLQASENASAKSVLAILHDWKRRKAGEAVSRKPEIKIDDTGNHYVAITVISFGDAPIEELSKLVTEIVNEDGLPQWMVQAGRRIKVDITETSPGTDSECYQLYGM